MVISQKSQYALRAIFELSRHYGEQKPVKISTVAQSQAIPPRFLENILVQLKQGGIVTSRRGKEGGYYLVRHPHTLTVGEVLRFIQGSYDPVSCVARGSKKRCPLYGDCAFLPMWEEARNAISNVYENTTFQYLLDREQIKYQELSFCYTI